MLLPIVLVRILPQESVGDYKIFFLYLSLAPAFAFISGLISNVPFWSGQVERSLESLKASFQLVLASATIFTLIALCAATNIANAFGWSLSQANLFAIAIFGTVGHQFIEDCLISKGKIWSSALFSGSFEIIKGILLVFSAWYWNSTTAVFASFGLVMGLKVLVAILIGIKNQLLSWKVNWRNIYNVANKAAPISLAALLGIFIDRADQFVLSNSLSAADFAIYSLGCLIVPPLLSLESSIMRVSIPQIASALSQKSFKNAASLHSYAVEQLALLIMPASIGLIVFADPIIALLFTPQYQEAAGFLRIFALSYLILILPFDACARAIGNTSWIFRSFILFSIICISFACIGAWTYGAYGALIATIMAKTLMRLWGFSFTKRTLKSSLTELLPITSLTKELCLLAIIASASILLKPLFASSFLWLIICGTAFIAIYLPIALILRNSSALKLVEQPRILQLVQTLQIGGLEKMVVSLAIELGRDPGAQVQILAYDQPDLPQSDLLSDFAHANNVKLTELRKSPGFSYYTLISLIRLILIERINVVHTHNIGPLLYAGIARIVTFGKFKIIHSNHSFTELDKFPRYRIYEKFLSKLCNNIVGVSPEIVESYKSLGIASKNLTVIANGIDSSVKNIEQREEKIKTRKLLIEELKLDKLHELIDQTWIISVARLHPLKGQDRVIEIWNQLSEETRNKTCVIFIGPDSDSDFAAALRKLACESKQNNRIIFAGAINAPQKWYEIADLFISCSRLEGMPLAPLEALFAGLPVILSEIEGHKFMADKAAILDANSPALAAKILSDFLSSQGTLEAQKDRAISASWAKSNFSISSMAKHYFELYREALR